MTLLDYFQQNGLGSQNFMGVNPALYQDPNDPFANNGGYRTLSPYLPGQAPSDPQNAVTPMDSAPQASMPSLPRPLTPSPAVPSPTLSPVSAPKSPGLMGLLQDPAISKALMSAGAAMMAASGPSRVPGGTGAAFGNAINAGMQTYDQARAIQMQRAEQQQALNANQWTTLSADDAKKVIPGGVAPGFVAQRNANGDIRMVGQNVMMSGTGYDANGYPVTRPVDIRNPVNLNSGSMGAPGASGSNTQKIAHLIATYQMAPLSSFAMKTPSGQAIMAAVATENPQYNANMFTEYQKGFKDFGTGKQGQQVKSFGVAMSHLDTLSQLTDALNNGDIQAANKIGNYFSSQTGGTAPTNFNAAKNVVSQEIVKAVTGAAGALGDRETAEKTLDAANSPAQLKQVIATYKQLMAGQLQGLQRQFQSSTGRNDFAQAMDLPPDVVGLLGGGQNQLPDGWSVQVH